MDQRRERALAENRDRIFGLALRLCGGNHADAEDLAQEALVVCLIRLPWFLGKSSLSTWMYAVTVRTWRSRQKSRAASALSLTGFELPAPGNLLDNHLDRLDLDHAVGALPDAQREAFVLVKAEGLTHREAARILNVPIGTVQWRVHDACLRLRSLLSESEYRHEIPLDSDTAVPSADPDAQLADSARQWHADVTSPESLSAAVRRRVEAGSVHRRARWVPALGAGVGLAALAATIALPLVRPTPAIASVRSAMQSVRTARWSFATETQRRSDRRILKRERGTTLVDLERSAARVQTEPDEIYIRTRNGVKWTRNGRPLRDDRPVSDAELTADLRRRLFPQDRIRGQERDWSMETVVVEGRTQQHFVHNAPGPDTPTSTTGNGFQEFWADASSHRIVRTRQIVPRRTESGDLVDDIFTTQNYTYDAPIPADAFALK